MKTRLPTHKVIIERPYPRSPGLAAKVAAENRIEVWTISDTGRLYNRVGVFDYALVQSEGDPEIGKLVLEKYVLLISLKPDRSTW